jgi:type IV secretory pathway protease TraF
MIRRRFLLAGMVAVATLTTLAVPVTRYAVWNASASVPTGLYAIRGKASLHVRERVAIDPPPELRRLLGERGYLPTGVPLIKRIAAVSGERVCRFGHRVTIDGDFAGIARARDRLGRPLPAWFGCLTASMVAISACCAWPMSSAARRRCGPMKQETATMSGSPIRAPTLFPRPTKETDPCVLEHLLPPMAVLPGTCAR